MEGVACEDVEESVNAEGAASGSNLGGLKDVGPFAVGMVVAVAAAVGAAVVGMEIADKLVAVQMPKEMDEDQVGEEAPQEAGDLGWLASVPPDLNRP